MQFHYRIGALALIALLVACGGKGSDDDAVPAAALTPVVPVASTLGFPLRAAHAVVTLRGENTVSLWAKGTAETASVNGLCSGTLVLNATPINYSQSFEGSPVQFSINSISTTLINCDPVRSDAQAVIFYDGNYLPLGSEGPGIYSRWTTLAQFPGTVTVGMSGTVGTEQLYTDSTKTTPLGKIDYSYVVEPDTATSAIVNLIARRFDAANQLQHTVQQRRRIRVDSTFELVSWEKQNAAPSTMHLIFRR